MQPLIRRPSRRPARAWLAPGVLAAAALALFAGAAQFGFTAIAADVAAEFGEPLPADDDDPLAQVGLGLTTLGIGFAIVRLASLGSLPAAGLADRFGRRRTLITLSAVGLAATAAAGASVTFWMLIALLALSRPLLTATDAVAVVIAAEETTSRDRSAAIGLISGAYAVGSGLISVVRGLIDPLVTFRGVLVLMIVPLLLLPWVARHVEEPPRYRRVASRALRRRLGSVPPTYRPRLALLCVITAGMGLVVGPAWTYLFVYGEGVLDASPLGMGVLVIAAGPVGLLGLIVGRWGAERFGRRIAAGASMVATAVAGAIAYAGGFTALAVGYLASITAGGVYAPSGGAMDTEVFPTSVRATAAGWLAASGVLGSVGGLFVFGVVADATGSFAVAAVLVSAPAAALAALYALLPETRGQELEESAPEPDP